MQPDQRSKCVICLAGHIDHGKSALVRALTGSTMDRLPEEKRRGITIELGFAHFDTAARRFALIDVPGHERLIHTMVAGASGVDGALLVVAADDSVMPQTLEHLAVLELLGIKKGVIAITKCDLADAEQLQFVEMEIAELVANTFLANSPSVRVSAITGQGIEELRQALVDVMPEASLELVNAQRFRMPIDRAFSREGQGAVVTGTVWRGIAHAGDTLQLLPTGTSVRVRRLQSQNKDVDKVTAGERAALNLAGIKASEIRRGDELTSPRYYAPSRRLLAQLRILPDARQGLKHRQWIRLHLGANQVTAQVLMDQRLASPGDAFFAAIRCKTPVVAEYGQPLVLRQLSPVATIGGGRVICPILRPQERLKQSLASTAGLAADDLSLRLLSYVTLRREVKSDEDLAIVIGLTPAQRTAALDQLLKSKVVVGTGGPIQVYVTVARWMQLKQRLLRRLQQELERRRPASRVPLSHLMAAMRHLASEPVVVTLLDDMVAQQELVRHGDRIGLPSGGSLSHRQRELLSKLLAEFAAAGRAPPTDKELAERHKLPPAELIALLQVAIDDGHLVRLSPQMAIDVHAIEALRQNLAEHFQRQTTAKLGELREQLGITRKYAVPIFEFFDERKITVRSGDLRTAGPCLTTPVDAT